MNPDFSRCLSLLRQERGISQRAAAKELGISQALLSHYENGVREPGLAFVVNACDFYRVSADFLLGRTLARDGAGIVDVEELYDASAERDNVLRGSLMATLNKKLLVNSIGVLFDLLGKVGKKEAITAAADYLGVGVYKLFRRLYSADENNNPDLFSVPNSHFLTALPEADMACSEVDYVDALAAHVKEKGEFPPMDNETMARTYPGTYQSLMQIVHTTGERMDKRTKKDPK